MALVTAAAAIVLVFSYGSRLGRWTVEYSKGGRVVIGQTLTQDARNYTQGRRERGEPPLNDRALLRYYGREQVKEVWLAEEIEHRQESLDRMYLLTILALGSGVVCASQACFCATRRQ